MDLKYILGQLEQIRQAPCTSEENKAAIDEACRRLKGNPSTDAIIKVIQLFAALAGIANYVEHIKL